MIRRNDSILVKRFAVIFLSLAALILAGAEPYQMSMVYAQSYNRDATLAGSPQHSPEVGADDSYVNCRFGLALVSKPIDSYAVDPLNLGWYLNWSYEPNPLEPDGIEYAQMVRVNSDGYVPSGSDLSATIAANPGSIWLIGNEPDSQVQDNVLPETYAQHYHDIYNIIKNADPTARLAAGGVVQPTPLRMEYLDRVLRAYVEGYGEPLPVDAWHIHSFILPEAASWGAGVPVGLDADHGELYVWPDETDDLGIFEARLRDFRQWMASRGYRDVPLWVTEYGTLADYYYGDPFVDSDGDPFDEARAREFMLGTFDLMLSMEDVETGYPADDHRLVQRWVWYSSDDPNYGGLLFDPMTAEPMMLARAWHTYTASISRTVDLLPASIEQLDVPFSPSNPATTTLRVRISNAGNIALTEPVTVTLSDAESGNFIIEPYEVEASLPGCASFVELEFDWTNLSPGAHTLRVEVDPTDRVTEVDEANNVMEATVLIARTQTYLPLVFRTF